MSRNRKRFNFQVYDESQNEINRDKGLKEFVFR